MTINLRLRRFIDALHFISLAIACGPLWSQHSLANDPKDCILGAVGKTLKETTTVPEVMSPSIPRKFQRQISVQFMCVQGLSCSPMASGSFIAFLERKGIVRGVETSFFPSMNETVLQTGSVHFSIPPDWEIVSRIWKKNYIVLTNVSNETVVAYRRVVQSLNQDTGFRTQIAEELQKQGQAALSTELKCRLHLPEIYTIEEIAEVPSLIDLDATPFLKKIIEREAALGNMLEQINP